MPVFSSQLDPHSPAFAANREGMLARIQQLRRLEARAVDASERARPRFEKRGQLLPRERLARLLDPGAPFVEIGNMGGYLRDGRPPEESVPGAGVISGLGSVSGVRLMVIANDSGIDAGAITQAGAEKIWRAQAIALQQKLPLLFLVESAGANLLQYRVEMFIHGGATFHRLARLSAAGCPVITVLHGSSTAGGAYLPGMSDVVIGVRGRGQAFLAGPPLVRAATGEVAAAEDLGGVDMHATVSGLVEHVAEDDGDALRLAREVVARLDWGRNTAPAPPRPPYREPRYDPDQLAGLVPLDYRQPYDVHELMARLVDDSDLLPFKPGYGSQTVCVQAAVHGHACGFIGNNGPIDPDGAAKTAQFIQLCCQADLPLIFLQNTTGYMVGTRTEQAGMIKHGSKMIQAVANATVPRITLMVGASFGAGNYGMCGRAYEPDFLFSWPNAATGIMGGEQAATTMRLVAEASAARRGRTPDPEQLAAQEQQIVDLFSAQEDAFLTSGRHLDDGIIDPRESRRLLGYLLATCDEARRRTLAPSSFGVARM